MKKIRYIPYGYTIRDGRTEIDSREAEIIREIFEEYLKGASLKEIADSLTHRKIPYTEKTDVWDKARIARIIDNARYTGDEEFDPIIDVEIYEGATSLKAARQRNAIEKECEGIALLRNRIRCEECECIMVRRICSKRNIKESWTCTNDACGQRIRISDGDLLGKINILMNRLIENSELILPKEKHRAADTPVVVFLQRQIEEELQRGQPSEGLIIDKVGEIASQLYKETQAKKMIVAQIARKRAMLMKPQEQFNCDYFSDLIDHVTLSSLGKVTLHTKVETQVSEGGDEEWQ